MKNKKYLPRIIETKLHKYLETFGTICIEGTKGCGKTSTAMMNNKNNFNKMN